MRQSYFLRRLCRNSALAAFLVLLGHAAAYAQSPAPAPLPSSVIPPIVLQGCAQKRTGNGSAVFPYRSSFDLSFVNLTTKTAKVVMVRVGGTDFAKVGTFGPGSTTAWKIDAKSFGTFEAQNCSIQAIRFDDGSEWSAPVVPTVTQSP
jgi:hypothetical protein